MNIGAAAIAGIVRVDSCKSESLYHRVLGTKETWAKSVITSLRTRKWFGLARTCCTKRAASQ